jgi:peptidoglycan/xylan/chitin deacetylase (PgdA/CDA1 family)
MGGMPSLSPQSSRGVARVNSVKPHIVALTIDVEEWNVPRNFGINHPSNGDVNISANGTKRILDFLREQRLRATFFVTGFFAERRPEIVMRIRDEGHEIGCHSYRDEMLTSLAYIRAKNSIDKATKILSEIVGDDVIGFRAPMCSISKSIIAVLKEDDYRYDSSVHPTFIPGRYNMLSYPPHPFYFENSILEIPISVTPYLRLPVGWWWLRNLGAKYTVMAAKTILSRVGALVFYFHPWDVVTPVRVRGVPWHIYRNTGEKMLNVLKDFIKYVKGEEARFCTLTEVYEGVKCLSS